jgi:hypothetical protein
MIPCIIFAKSYDANKYGIVIASTVNGRLDHSINSKVVTNFSFGSPIEIISKSNDKVIINGKEDYWYQEKISKSWVFGGYIILSQNTTDNIVLLKTNTISRNPEIDGIVLDPNYKSKQSFSGYILFNEYYITTSLVNLYPQNDNDDFYSVTIGRNMVEGDKIIFKELYKEIYNYEGKWKYLSPIFTSDIILYRMKDQSFTYYVNEFTNISITEINSKYQTTNDSIYYAYYVDQKISFADLRKYLPIIGK